MRRLQSYHALLSPVLQGAEAVRAEAQVGCEHFLRLIIEAVPGSAECFGPVLQQRLRGLRIRADATLTAPLPQELIDHIDVHETEDKGKHRTQRVVTTAAS